MAIEQVRIVATQYTNGAQPVTIYVQSVDATGLFYPQPKLLFSTQDSLTARIADDTIRATGRWGDTETAAEVVAQLAARGITAEVVS